MLAPGGQRRAQDLEPSAPADYILKATVNLAVGLQLDSKAHLSVAQNYFQLVGSSASEMDTIPGRCGGVHVVMARVPARPGKGHRPPARCGRALLLPCGLQAVLCERVFPRVPV